MPLSSSEDRKICFHKKIFVLFCLNLKGTKKRNKLIVEAKIKTLRHLERSRTCWQCAYIQAATGICCLRARHMPHAPIALLLKVHFLGRPRATATLTTSLFFFLFLSLLTYFHFFLRIFKSGLLLNLSNES